MSTIALPSFRDGTEFELRSPDVDGIIEILDVKAGSKGTLIKTVALVVLRRSFEDVSLEEIGRMEFEDLGPVVKAGMEGVRKLDSLGFHKMSG